MSRYGATAVEIKLMRSVEGFQSSVLDETARGQILTPDQINELTKRQVLEVQPLIDFLRSNAPISSAVRNWIADLCENNRDVKLVLVPNTAVRPRHSRVKQAMLRRHAARYAVEKMKEYGDTKLKRAVEEAAFIYGISSTSIRKQIKLSEDIDANIGKLGLTK